MSEMWEEQDCLGNCANCGNTDCEWYDDWMDGYDDWMDAEAVEESEQ